MNALAEEIGRSDDREQIPSLVPQPRNPRRRGRDGRSAFSRIEGFREGSFSRAGRASVPRPECRDAACRSRWRVTEMLPAKRVADANVPQNKRQFSWRRYRRVLMQDRAMESVA